MFKKEFYLFLLILLLAKVNAQLCQIPQRFTEVPYFTSGDIDSNMNVTYGTAIDWQGNTELLKLNVYYPRLSLDSLALRPAIVLIHGGGFVSGSRADFNTVAFELAKRGFVVSTIDYRLGHNCQQDPLSYDKAVYRAMQDAHASIRYAVSNAGTIRIDTSWVFIGGASAGAGTSLCMAYLSQSEWNTYSPAIVSALGNLNNSGNSLTNTFSLKGIFNNWGGVGKDFMQVDEMLPTIAFHGDADPTVNIDSAARNSCTNAPMIYGSRMIHNTLLENGICSDLTVEIGGGHGIYNDSYAAKIFRAGRVACFFRSVMCTDCTNFYSTDSIAASCSNTFSLITESDVITPTIYPNPTKDVIFISFPLQSYSLELFNAVGGKIVSFPNRFDNGSISVETLPNGIYFLRITTAEEYFIRKIMKQ